jgi:phytoene synthase
MIQLAHKKDIPRERIEAFLDAMIQDTQKKRYNTYQELQHYMYGSAEVI